MFSEQIRMKPLNHFYVPYAAKSWAVSLVAMKALPHNCLPSPSLSRPWLLLRVNKKPINVETKPNEAMGT